MREISIEAMDREREQKLNPFVKRNFKTKNEDNLDRRNSWNHNDLTPYNAVRAIKGLTITY